MTNPRIEVSADVSEQFELIEEKLVYVDAPLEGLARSKTGELFAFRCSSIVPGHLWHWVLLPVSSLDASVEEAFESARIAPPKQWISIVEDRRGNQPRVTAARLVGGIPPIPH